MEMMSEQWIKEKYDELLLEQRQDYALVSLKIKQLRRLNILYGRGFVDELILEFHNALLEAVENKGYAAYLQHGYYNLLLQLPEKRDDYSLVMWFSEILHKTYYLTDKRFEKIVYCGLGVYRLEDNVIDFYTAQYYADICRTESKERDFLISHVEFYGSSYQDIKLNAQEYRRRFDDALHNKHIHLYLQPKVNLKTKEVESAEALMRWIDPELGLLPINEYLPVLEESGQMNLVDCYIFEETCKVIEHWSKVYKKEISISVNVSKSTFVYPFFLNEFEDIHKKYDCKKECIELELIENIILNQSERVKEVVDEIKKYGYRVSLDDFGSGYSSYSVLCNTPFDAVKIDRSLFLDHTNPKEKILAKHIIEIAHELGMEVVAEGIETKEYVDELTQIGCDYIQGFYFYKSMPVEEFEEIFIKNKVLK